MTHCTIPPPQCAATSVGTANQLFLSIIQSLIVSQCNISSPSHWPRDYGEIALEYGIF